MRKEVSEEKLKDYLEKTKKGLEIVKISVPERSYLYRLAEDFLEMARAYNNDAVHFYRKGDFVNAFACVNYAHGWLDAGARIGLFDVGTDDKLFTLWE
ncbi:MAG: DUF357 domain-containing protein [Thermoplasmata archaeon]|nr:DUF357 domain-containing protein [Thermoplasmata archaeon]